MRTARLVIALAAGAVASVAVPANAAGMLNDGAGLAAGTTVTLGCDDDGVSTSYSVASGNDGFVVGAVGVEGIAAACAGGAVHVELQSSDGSRVAAGSTTVSGTTETVRLTVPPAVTDVAAVHVVLSR